MRKKILKAVTAAAAAVFIIAGCMLDGTKWTAALAAWAISGAWLALYAYANGYMNIDNDRKRKFEQISEAGSKAEKAECSPEGRKQKAAAEIREMLPAAELGLKFRADFLQYTCFLLQKNKRAATCRRNILH